MDAKTRANFVRAFISDRCMAVMGTKGKEYSRNEADVNSNFKRVAAATGLTPVQVCYVYLAKHLDSIAYWVRTGETHSDEPIEGRIGDAINYLFILAALNEEYNSGPNKRYGAPGVSDADTNTDL